VDNWSTGQLIKWTTDQVPQNGTTDQVPQNGTTDQIFLNMDFKTFIIWFFLIATYIIQTNYQLISQYIYHIPINNIKFKLFYSL
jgi:hypothetical protein